MGVGKKNPIGVSGGKVGKKKVQQVLIEQVPKTKDLSKWESWQVKSD